MHDDLDIYNGGSEHDMMIDSGYHINTGELSEVFNGEGLDFLLQGNCGTICVLARSFYKKRTWQILRSI